MKTNIKEWTANTLKSEQKVNSREVQTLFPVLKLLSDLVLTLLASVLYRIPLQTVCTHIRPGFLEITF